MEKKSEDANDIEANEKTNLKGVAFLMGVSGISLLSGFGYAVGVSRKSDPEMYHKGVIKVRNLHSAGSSLAVKALGWGTLYAISGFTVFCCLVWKLSGAKNMHEFRMKAGSILPQIPKNDPPQGRTEFKSLTDLLQYVIGEDVRIKNEKEQSKILSPPTIDKASDRV